MSYFSFRKLLKYFTWVISGMMASDCRICQRDGTGRELPCLTSVTGTTQDFNKHHFHQ